MTGRTEAPAAGDEGSPRGEADCRLTLNRAEWFLLLVLGSVQFTHILDFVIVMPLGSRFMRELNISPFQFDLLVAAYAVAAAISGLLAARIIDRFDRKSALLVLY